MAAKSEDVIAGTKEYIAKYIVISDLHIGMESGDSIMESISKSSSYFYSDAETCDYLLGLIAVGNKIVLNGDVFELWETDKEVWLKEFKSLAEGIKDGLSFSQWHDKQAKSRLELIIAKYPMTMKLITENPSIIYVNGNHDEATRTQGLIPKVQESYVIKQGGFSIYVAHGHQADIYCSGPYQGVGRFAACFCSVAEQLTDPELDIEATKLGDTIGILHDNDNTYTNHARLIAEEGNYDGVDYGHTHIQKLYSLDCQSNKKIPGHKIIYANSGKASHVADPDHDPLHDHERIDEIAHYFTADGKLETVMQQRYPFTGKLLQQERFTKTSKGEIIEESLDQTVKIAPIHREVVVSHTYGSPVILPPPASSTVATPASSSSVNGSSASSSSSVSSSPITISSTDISSINITYTGSSPISISSPDVSSINISSASSSSDAPSVAVSSISSSSDVSSVAVSSTSSSSQSAHSASSSSASLSVTSLVAASGMQGLISSLSSLSSSSSVSSTAAVVADLLAVSPTLVSTFSQKAAQLPSLSANAASSTRTTSSTRTASAASHPTASAYVKQVVGVQKTFKKIYKK
jgi:predicted phosphodiesterase